MRQLLSARQLPLFIGLMFVFTVTDVHPGSSHDASMYMCTWHWHINGGALSLALARLTDTAAPRPHLLLVHVDEEHRVILIEKILHDHAIC